MLQAGGENEKRVRQIDQFHANRRHNRRIPLQNNGEQSTSVYETADQVYFTGEVVDKTLSNIAWATDVGVYMFQTQRDTHLVCNVHSAVICRCDQFMW